MDKSEIPHKSLWKRHRRKVWTSLALGLAVGWLHQERAGREAKERTWELAARLGLSTDWKQWYAHEYYPEPEDNVACHPLFAALRSPGGGNPQFHVGGLGAEAQSALPAGVNVAEFPEGKLSGITDVLNLVKDHAGQPLSPSAIIAATQGIERITQQVLDADKRKGRNWRLANPVDYADPFSLPITAFSNVFETTKQLSAFWKVRTAAFLEQGDRASAQRELQALLAWGTFWDGRESLVCALVSNAVEEIVQHQLEPLLMHPGWTAADLASFDASLARRDLLRSMFFSMRYVACGLLLTDDLLYQSLMQSRSHMRSRDAKENFIQCCLHLAPGSVRAQNARVMSEYMSQLIGNAYDPGTGLARPAPWAHGGHPTPPIATGINNFIAAITVPALCTTFQSSERLQTNYNHDRVLIALRQYYLANGAYPAQLQQLKTELPIDRVTGEPIHYHLAPDQSKLHLWSANHSGKPGDNSKPPKDHAKERWISLELSINL